MKSPHVWPLTPKRDELQETIAVRDGGILFHVIEDKDKEKSILTGRIFMVNHMSKH